MISNNIDIPKEEAKELFVNFINFHPDYEILEQNIEDNPDRFKYRLKNYIHNSRSGTYSDTLGTIEFISTEDGTFYFLDFISKSFNSIKIFILFMCIFVSIMALVSNFIIMSPNSDPFTPLLDGFDIAVIGFSITGPIIGIFLFFFLDYSKRMIERKFENVVVGYMQHHRKK